MRWLSFINPCQWSPFCCNIFFPNNHVCSIFVNIFPAKHTPMSMKATSFYFIRLVLHVVISLPIYHNFFKPITRLDKKQARKFQDFSAHMPGQTPHLHPSLLTNKHAHHAQAKWNERPMQTHSSCHYHYYSGHVMRDNVANLIVQ